MLTKPVFGETIMTKNTLFLLVVTLFGVACSRDPYRGYLGLWELSDSPAGVQAVLELKRDGDTILFNDNVLATTNFWGLPKTPTVVSQRDGQLSISNGASFGLSGDHETLLLGDLRYKRSSEARVEEIRTQRAEDKRNAKENRARCEALGDERQKELDALPSQGAFAVASAQRQQIMERYATKAKGVPNCTLNGRW